TALAEVPEQDRVHTVLADQAAELTQKVAEPFRRHPGVLPRRQTAVLTRDARVLAAAAPYLPHLGLVPRVLDYFRVPGRQPAHSRFGPCVGLVLGIAAVLGEQPGATGRQLVDSRHVLAVLVNVVDDALVEALQAD